MKNKTFSKKLLLNKKTVADLSKKDMGAVWGGSFNTCHTDCGQNTCGCTDGSCDTVTACKTYC